MEQAHADLARCAAHVGATRAALNSGVSVHYSKPSMSFAQLETFLESACKVVDCKSRFQLGSLGRDLVVSVMLREAAPPSAKGKKRGYDDSAERAKEAAATAVAHSTRR